YLWYSTGLGCRPRLAAGGTEISRSGAGRKVPGLHHRQMAARDGSGILPSIGTARENRQAFHGYAQQTGSGRVQGLGTTGLSVATRTVLTRTIHAPRKSREQCQSRDELGGAKAQRRTASMTFMMLGCALEFFPGIRFRTWVCRPPQGRGPLPYIRTVAVCTVRDHLFV